MNPQENPNYPSSRENRKGIRTVLTGAFNVDDMLQNITGTLNILKQWEDGYEKKQARNNFAMARIVYGLDTKPEWMIEQEAANKKRKYAAEKKKKAAVAKAMANTMSAVDKGHGQHEEGEQPSGQSKEEEGRQRARRKGQSLAWPSARRSRMRQIREPTTGGRRLVA